MSTGAVIDASRYLPPFTVAAAEPEPIAGTLHGRPDCGAPEVFVRLKPPLVKLGNSTGSTLMRRRLDRAGIELNYNSVPFDPRKPFDPSGLRIGTPAITTRGLREEHMAPLAAWMDEAVTAAAKGDEATLDRIAGEVRDLLSAFPAPGWNP